jgi:hypothetical protein
MKIFVQTAGSWLLVLFLLGGCSEDAPPPITVSFASQKFSDWNGRIEIVEDALPSVVSSAIRVYLSEPAPSDVYVYLATSGDARLNEDYTFTNQVVIRKGEQAEFIYLQFVDDKLLEFDEEGIFTIERALPVGSIGRAIMPDTTTGRFLIRDNDSASLGVSLSWGGDGSDRINMDLYLWRETSPGSNAFEVVQKMNSRFTPGHQSIVLSGLEEDGLYGLSYVYHEGHSDKVSLKVTFEAYGGAILEGGAPRLEFNAVYGLKNINPDEPTTIREQYFVKEGFQYRNLTPIAVPESGS